MLFPTIDFAVFFVIVFSVNWMLRRWPLPWKVFMLAASYFFYGYWDWRFILLLAGSSVFNHGVALGMQRCAAVRRRKALLVLAVVFNLGVLGFFKYSRFLAEQVLHVWLQLDLDIEYWFPLLDYVGGVILPVGISFFTFQALSYVLDVYRGSMPPAASLLDFALYLAFFPQLVAGPIVRARDLVPQIHRPRVAPVLDTGRAACLILGGLFKKIVIANFLAESIVDRVFANPGFYGAWDTLFAVYAYAIQIYCDFSAYSDIAIGLCLLLGVHIPLNFDAPYWSDTIQGFWRRWHMSLSYFLRDYLYIPLGGSRCRESKVYRNLMITFLLGGLWHGAGWTFIVWGGLHGLYLCVERLLVRTRRRPPGNGWLALLGRRLLVWHLVCLAWLFFRCATFADAWAMLGNLTRWNVAPQVLSLPMAIVLLAGYASQGLDGDRIASWWDAFRRLPGWGQGMLAGVLLTVILALGPSGVAPFIYFQF